MLQFGNNKNSLIYATNFCRDEMKIFYKNLKERQMKRNCHSVSKNS
jgi:hypothetical protein